MIDAKVSPWKRDRVGELAAILSSDGVLGVVDIGGVPAKNMQHAQRPPQQHEYHDGQEDADAPRLGTIWPPYGRPRHST